MEEQKPKMKISKKLIKLILVVIGIIIAIIICAGAIIIIKVKEGSYNPKDSSNTGNVVRQQVYAGGSSGGDSEGEEENGDTAEGEGEGIGEIVNDGGNWKFDINLDTTVDEIIAILEEENGAVFKYISEKNLHEYLKAFIQAELITQYPDLRSDFSAELGEGEFQGCIQVQRAKTEGGQTKTERLTYIDNGTFNSYKDGGDEQIFKHFTMDSDGNIIVAGWTRTTTNITSNVSEIPSVTDKVEYEIITQSINYKSMVEKFTMPFDLLWGLTVAGEDEDFAYNVAQLALNSKIVFTAQEENYVTTEEIMEEYELQIKEEKQAILDVNLGGMFLSAPYDSSNESVVGRAKVTQNIKTEECSVNLDMTYADTWLAKYEKTNTINDLPDNGPQGPNVQTVPATDYELTSTTLPVRQKTELQRALLGFMIEKTGKTASELHVPVINLNNPNEKITIVSKDGTITGTVNNITYKKYSRKGIQTISTTNQTTGNYCVEGTPNIDEKVERDSDEENFITLYLDSKSARNNIKSIPSILFEILENSDKTADMVDIIKYLLYKSDDDKRADELTSIEDFLEDAFKKYEPRVGDLGKYLLQFSHVNVPMAADGFYLMYIDGYGNPTIGAADIMWSAHYWWFEGKAGKIIHNGVIKDVADVAQYINTNCMTKGAEATYTQEEIDAMNVGIEVNLVDRRGESLRMAEYEYVINVQAKGIDLTMQQAYALTAIQYHYGLLPEADDGRTFKQVYLDGIEKEGYEERSWKHNMYVWDNWWYQMSENGLVEYGGGLAGTFPSTDATYETYVKGIIDFKNSKVTQDGVVWVRDYMFFTEEQLDNAKITNPPRDNGENKEKNFRVLRTKQNEEETFTMEEFAGGVLESDESYIKEYYISTTGRIFTIFIQGSINGWSDKCNRAASAIIASAYTSENPDTMIKKVNGFFPNKNDEHIPNDDYWNSYGLTRTEYWRNDSNTMGGNEARKLIVDQLKKGGYLAVRVVAKDEDGGVYTGSSSGHELTGLYHWMAIIDYRKEDGKDMICIADWRGHWWAESTEFNKGINGYALIEEL